MGRQRAEAHCRTRPIRCQTLFLAQREHEIAFASEAKGILALDRYRRASVKLSLWAFVWRLDAAHDAIQRD